jgi:phosphoribosylamine--glycine ligase
MIGRSKSFAKDFMLEHKIPTARGGTWSTYAQAFHVWKHLDEMACLVDDRGPGAQIVIKADGEDAFFPQTKEQALQKFGELLPDSASWSGNPIVYEEFLHGKEISVLSFSDGKMHETLPCAQIQKYALNGNLRVKTKGMGCIAPADLDSAIEENIKKIIDKIFQAFKLKGGQIPTIL